MYRNQILFIVLLLVIVIVNESQCIPVNYFQSSTVKQAPPTPPEIIAFMRKFGYLDKTTSQTEALYHEDAIINAIKNVQRYGALNQTGVLDNKTLKLISSPRCGVPDIPMKIKKSRKKRFVLGGFGWGKRRITYYIANWSPKIGEYKVAQGMQKAFGEWAKYGNLRFERVYHPGADIIVAFGSGHHGDYFPFDGPGNILAHAFYPYEMQAWGGDIHFDSDENWKENSTHLSQGVDFVSVAVHELGHSLGLAHSPVYSSIMFPYYKGPSEARTLQYDDIMAMYELYIKNRLPEDDDYYTTRQSQQTTVARYYPNDSPTYASPSTRNRYRSTTAPPEYDESYESEENTDDAEDTDDENEDDNDDGSSPRFTTNGARSSPTFHGDFETVDRYKTRYGSTVPYSISTTLTLPQTTIAPDFCADREFDNIALFRGGIFAFKDEYVWKLNEKFAIEAGYPRKIHQLFTQLPKNVTHIDAAYERQNDQAILVFSAKQYWVFPEYHLHPEGPQLISNFGFHPTINKIDAAMVWSKNRQTYLFSGGSFLRFNEDRRAMDKFYPASIVAKWRGIPSNITAALSLPNGQTYFFKGSLFWLYNNYWIRPDRGYPKKTWHLFCKTPKTLKAAKTLPRA